MAVILKTQSVTKKFGGITAVEKVSLSVSQGEVRFIIGPNGAGKSTFFKLIIGPALPIAIIILPQFGSSPAIAVLTKGELPIENAIFLASNSFLHLSLIHI